MKFPPSHQVGGTAQPSPESEWIACVARLSPGPGELARAEELLAVGCDIRRIATWAEGNRLIPLIYANTRGLARLDGFPFALDRFLRDRVHQELVASARLEAATRELLLRFDDQRVPAILLRGLAVGERVYGQSVLRPYRDLDFLVPKNYLAEAKAVLRAAHYGPAPGALEDAYYERHHLHLTYAHEATGLLVELHWALDHPFTTWLVDYAELFRGAQPGTIAGAPALLLEPEDLLLSLCLHYAKHCPCANVLAESPRVTECLLENGWWLHVLDVAQALERLSDALDGQRLLGKARRWNVVAPLQAGLLTAHRLFRAPLPIPSAELVTMPIPPLTRRIQAGYFKRLCGKGARNEHVYRRDWGFRLLRLWDALPFLWPDAGYFRKRYPNAPTAWARIRHFFSAAVSLARAAAGLFLSRRNARQ